MRYKKHSSVVLSFALLIMALTFTPGCNKARGTMSDLEEKIKTVEKSGFGYHLDSWNEIIGEPDEITQPVTGLQSWSYKCTDGILSVGVQAEIMRENNRILIVFKTRK